MFPANTWLNGTFSHTIAPMQTDKTNPTRRDPQPLREVLEHSLLGYIVERAKFIDHVHQVIGDLIPAEAANHYRVMNVQENTLSISVSNAAWATKLRFLAPNLLQDLRAALAPKMINAVNIVVRPE